MAAGTLYASGDRTRFFLVRDDVELPPGEYAVRSLSGKKIESTVDALVPYEVPEEEAMRLTRESLGALQEKARAVAMAAARALSAPARTEAEAAEGRERRVAEALKIGREQLRDDPKAVGSALKSLLEGVLKAAKDSEVAPGVAEARMKDVGETLRQEGADESLIEPLESLPGKLRELLEGPEVLGALERAAADLRAAAAELRADTAREREASAQRAAAAERGPDASGDQGSDT